MVLNITKNRQHYAKVVLAREFDVAVKQAQDFASRFHAEEGFELKLYRHDAMVEQVDFLKFT
jgi:hypothetical protein